MGRVFVVVGGQFGSEGKGAIAAFLTSHLAQKTNHPVCVRVGGPNAGHTVIDAEGETWKLRQIPVGVVRDVMAPLVIGQGSEIDLPVLQDEIERLEDAGYQVRDRLFVDRACTIIRDEHKERETELIGKIGSTGKGIGAARADRIMRSAELWEDVAPEGDAYDTSALLRTFLSRGNDVVIESTQGYGLGLHTRFYPKCTSGNVRVIDTLAQSGVSPWWPEVQDMEPWVVFRTRPIRVAGKSGELKNETTWEELGLEPERTTVTNKVRRIGEWDSELAREAIHANGADVHVALTMVDQVFPELENQGWEAFKDEHREFIKDVEKDIGAQVCAVGTGPSSHFLIREDEVDNG